ncbi:MAG: hypothetical protein WCG02_02800 [Candidatus Taylorbacteria bacterium]
MKLTFLPEKSKDYYKYMLCYWIAIWSFAFLISSLSILPRLSEGGYTFRQDTCLEYTDSGRFNESRECVDYGQPIYLPVGKFLSENFRSYGLWSGFSVLVIGLFLRNGKKFREKNELRTYEFINDAGDEEVYTLGYRSSGEFDIYWEDILASKNNREEIITADGTGLIISDFDPSEATDFINTSCPICNRSVDRFYYIENFSKKDDEYGDSGWMEVCFKCRKLIYFDTSSRD